MTEFFEYTRADGAWNGTDDGFQAVNFDPALAVAGLTPTAGTLYLARVSLRGAATITKAAVNYFAAAATPSGTYLALYDTSGNQLAVTADESSTFSTTTGFKQASFADSVDLLAGDYFVGFLVNSAGTVPHLAIAGTVGVNLARTGFNSRFATGPTGNTTTAPAATITTPTALSDAIWAGIS